MKRGRPAAGGPVICVRLDGRAAAWCDGELTGDAILCGAARAAARVHEQTTLIDGREVTCDLTTPAGALGALTIIAPRRVEILRGRELLEQTCVELN